VADKGLRQLCTEVIDSAEDWPEYGEKKSLRVAQTVIKIAAARGYTVSPHAVIGELTCIWDIKNGRRRCETSS